MSAFSEPAELPEGFAGVVRLFPLPNLVVFPYVVQALHIFEPRYREMIEDALAGDQLIAMAHLQAGWEADYEGRPAIWPVVCVGRVISHVRLANGHYNVLLQGLKRAAVVREFPPDHAFRLAEVAILEDLYPADGAARRTQIQRELLQGFERLTPDSAATREQIEQLAGQQIPLGVLTDILSYTLPLELDIKQQLLAEWNVDLRSSLLLQQLRLLAEDQGTGKPPVFPPGFSSN